MDDSDLMSHEQQTVLRLVIAARNAGATNIHAAVRSAMKTPPPSDVITTAIRILELEAVNHQRGESADIVIARILDLIESQLDGQDIDELPPGTDDRY
ncbi:hypothetical protein [Nocardia sp. CC227C]|uniref:hypothetical protein n=1 Tax=Nocardia sp. CC227C TaxID=3044562 RepID=UPI00278C135A|nr:hypothetical protein [Nocardia sp. CC227C]